MVEKILYLSLRNIAAGRHDLVTPDHLPGLVADGLIVRIGTGYQLTEKGKSLLAELKVKLGIDKAPTTQRPPKKTKGFGIDD